MDSWAEAMEHWVKLRPALWEGKAKRDTLEASKELYRQLLEEAADEEAAEAQRPAPSASLASLDASAQPRTGFRARHDYATEAGLYKRRQALNPKQTEIWKEVTETLSHQKQHKTSECTCESPPAQLIKFVSGGAGVGKSRLIELICEALESVGELVVMAAPSGLAAQNIEGITCHRAFRLPVQKSRGPWQYNQLSHQGNKELYHCIGKASLVIIDEISMVSNTMLELIHLRLSSALGKEAGDGTVFGGLNVLVLGDLLQLPPVNAPYGFIKMTQLAYQKMMRGRVGLAKVEHLWQRFSYAELTQNMRQNEDGEFAELLNRLRVGDVSKGMELLEKKTVQDEKTPKGVAGLLWRLEKEGKRPVCLLPTLERVSEVNAAALVAKGLQPTYLHAVDQLTNRKPSSTRPPQPVQGRANEDPAAAIVHYINSNTKRKTRDTGGMPQILALAPGARVMLLRNLDVEKGLYNGKMGTVKRLVGDAGAPDGVGHVVVHFDGIGDEPIERLTGSYFVAGAEVKRSQFPLMLAYAITIHKAQGLSLDCVVTELNDDIFASGMSYVALSRCRTLDGLYLLGLDPNYITCDLKAVSEYNRLRATYTDLPAMVAAPRKDVPRMMTKRRTSRPLAEAGLCQPADSPDTAEPPKKSSSRRQPLTKKKRGSQDDKGFRGLGFVPLRNGANWCFANSAVQALLSCDSVRDWAKEARPHDSHIRSCLKELCEAREAAQPPLKDTALLRSTISRLNAERTYLDGNQHDSSEFLENLIAAEPELKRLFWVESSEKKHCLDCGLESEQSAEGMLTVVLKRPTEGMVAWADLLSDFLCDKNQVLCESCASRRGAECNSTVVYQRRLVFPAANRFLLVRVPRFGRFGQQSPDTRISGFKAAAVDVCGARFKAVAAVLHQGESPVRGHYMSFVRHQNSWLLHSDDSATIHNKFLSLLNYRKGASAAYLVLQRQL